ncbi:MAG: hypothetical protein RSD36_14215 [Terrisporobacter sp.]
MSNRKKIIPALLLSCLVLSGSALNVHADEVDSKAIIKPTIETYYEVYAVSKTGYTGYIKKMITGSNAVCNNQYIANATSHTAQLFNSQGKFRSASTTISEGSRKTLNVRVTEGGVYAAKGNIYKQKHVVPKLGVIARGTYSVDNKEDGANNSSIDHLYSEDALFDKNI